MAIIAHIVSAAIQLYILLILAWVLGSWFPQWRQYAWYRMVEDLVRPYMNLFRVFPLRLGMIDLTPIVALFVLYFFQQLVLASAGR